MKNGDFPYFLHVYQRVIHYTFCDIRGMIMAIMGYIYIYTMNPNDLEKKGFLGHPLFRSSDLCFCIIPVLMVYIYITNIARVYR